MSKHNKHKEEFLKTLLIQKKIGFIYTKQTRAEIDDEIALRCAGKKFINSIKELQFVGTRSFNSDEGLGPDFWEEFTMSAIRVMNNPSQQNKSDFIIKFHWLENSVETYKVGNTFNALSKGIIGSSACIAITSAGIYYCLVAALASSMLIAEGSFLAAVLAAGVAAGAALISLKVSKYIIKNISSATSFLFGQQMEAIKNFKELLTPETLVVCPTNRSVFIPHQMVVPTAPPINEGEYNEESMRLT